MVIGGIDSGKSTLCYFLIDKLKDRSGYTALIDADLGQSTIGPPTTVGLSLIRGGMDILSPFSLRFVGSTSPRGHMLQTIVAVKKLLDKAIDRGARHVVIDTSGFISGPIGREFKYQKIDLISPTHIIALEKEEELSLLLRSLSCRQGSLIYPLKIDTKKIREKSPEERRQYRQERFKGYFKKAKTATLFMEKVGLHGIVPDLKMKPFWDHLLIALCDDENNALALGMITDIDLSKGSISFISPIKNMNKVKSIQFGSIFLSQEGEDFRCNLQYPS